ncbi:MAG TPA: hypothetical protein VFY26_02435 [Anaerolineales bacterium]|nr:hypothetical protein [Anaerolineales bacterium]
MATSRKNNSSKNTGKKTTRKSPGSGGQGNYYHIELRRDEDFETFRTQDVGDPGHIQRVAGKREGGSWATVKWLIEKSDAHVEDGRLVGDTQDAKDLLRRLRSRPVHLSGDRFEAKPRRSGSSRSGTGKQKKSGSQSSRKSKSGRSSSR